MNFIGNRNFRAGPQTSLEGFICPQNSDKQQKIKVFGRSEGGENFIVNILFISLQSFSYQDDNIAVQDDNIAVTIDTFE